MCKALRHMCKNTRCNNKPYHHTHKKPNNEKQQKQIPLKPYTLYEAPHLFTAIALLLTWLSHANYGVSLINLHWRKEYPDSKVRGANMGPTWVLSAPDGPHVGPMNLVIRVCFQPTEMVEASKPSSPRRSESSWYVILSRLLFWF